MSPTTHRLTQLSTLVEVAILLVTAPLLYFPDRVLGIVGRVCACEPSWLVPVAVVALALLWPLRRGWTGRWAAPLSPLLAGALWFWCLVMLPVAIWAAPPPLRAQYSWPRAYILIWNFSLFWSVLAHAGRDRRGLGWALAGWLAAVQGIALLAPFGMEARTKLPMLGRIQDLFPRPLMGVFAGAEEGFSTNQVAGVLLYVLPLMLALCAAGLRYNAQRRGQLGWLWWLLLACSGWMGGALLLTQSRGGLLGMLVALVVLVLLTRRWGWYALAVLAVVIAIGMVYIPVSLLDAISDAPAISAVGGVVTVSGFRKVVWEAGNLALGDFFLTGMGLGTFRVLVHLLYPLPGIPADFDLAHAHNFFLQTGLDFGVPGLAAILVLYVGAIVQLIRLAHHQDQRALWPVLPFVTPRLLAIGWMSCMAGQTVYSLFDAVAMGSKPNFVWWWWLALIFATGNLVLGTHDMPGNAEQPSPPEPNGPH